MPKHFAVALALAAFASMAPGSRAQTVGMYGEYHESNGIIINIPQNPPIVPCVPPPLTAMQIPGPHPTVMGQMSFQHLDLRPIGLNDARCHDREHHVNFSFVVPGVFNKPRIGARGARVISGGMLPGDPVTISPFAFQQNLGPQVGIILQNAVRQLDTTFQAAMPGIDRIGPNPGPPPAGSYTIKTPNQLAPAPALTRMFSQMNWQNPGNGQNNGRAVGFAARPAANTTINASAAGGNEKVRLRYAAGPRQFGGTMALLLDGGGRFYARPSTPATPALFKPAVATQPLAGDDDPGFRLRGAAGWDLTAVDVQRPGKIKAFFGGLNPANLFTPMGAPRVAPSCFTVTPVPLPVGCNEINGFDTFMAGSATTMLGFPAGGTLAALPGANVVKHMFPLTTGTVSIVRVALRNGTHYSDTVTGMGYDTIGVTTRGGVQRNLGLVAGSYTVRTDSMGSTQINAQMLGLNMKIIPEPSATAALAGGLGLLGLLAYHRSRSTSRAGSR